MSLARIVPPAVLPITLNELKAHARFDLSDEDALLVGYLRAAVDHIESSNGLALVAQTWRWVVDGFPLQCCDWIRLPIVPVLTVSSITYLDGTGAQQTLDPGDYQLSGDRITPKPPSTSWPATWHGLDTVVITFDAGFGPDHNFVPEDLRQVVMMIAAYWFAQREVASIGPEHGPVSHIPFGAREILQAYRVWMV
jgi:uncharacterized phiE125 gp8 family phage protein